MDEVELQLLLQLYEHVLSEAHFPARRLEATDLKEWHRLWLGNVYDKGNMRDEADVTQLVCLSNLENLNALFIAEGMPQQQRLERLNKIAIHQMTLLAGDGRMKLPGGEA